MGFDDALYEVREHLSGVAFRNELSGKDIKDLLKMLLEEEWGD